MILSGKLKIGDKLPSERLLAEGMKVSRSVVSAGLVDLKNKGFLRILPRSGTYVEDYRRVGKLETFVSLLKYNGGRFRREDALSLLRLRCSLKEMATEDFLKVATPKTLGELEAVFKRLRDAKLLSEQTQAAIAFDHELAFFSGNTMLPLIFSSFAIPYEVLMDEYFQMKGQHARYVELIDYYMNCLKQKDLPCAVASIRRGSQEAEDAILSDAWPLLP